MQNFSAIRQLVLRLFPKNYWGCNTLPNTLPAPHCTGESESLTIMKEWPKHWSNVSPAKQMRDISNSEYMSLRARHALWHIKLQMHVSQGAHLQHIKPQIHVSQGTHCNTLNPKYTSPMAHTAIHQTPNKRLPWYTLWQCDTSSPKHIHVSQTT